MRSLIVDDDPTCRTIYQILLGKYGQSNICSNGMCAIEDYRESLDKGNPYDLIVLDIMMPSMDGFTIRNNIRMLEQERGIEFPFCTKILFVTALDDEYNRQIADTLDSACEAYLVKSNNDSELLEKLYCMGFELD